MDEIEKLTKTNKSLEKERNKVSEDHQQTLKMLNTKHLADVDNKNQEIAALQEQVNDILNWCMIEGEKAQERSDLQRNLDDLKHKHEMEEANIKEERRQEIDKLRKEMLQNIRNVKTQMLTMNEEQL